MSQIQPNGLITTEDQFSMWY